MQGYGDLSEEFWTEWFGVGGRELGNPARRYAATPVGLSTWIAQNDFERRPSFMSVQPYRTRGRVACLERLFFDFDSPDLEKAWEDARGFAQTLQAFYEVSPLLCFSGRKGYHVHLWLQTPVGGDLSQGHLKELYRELQTMLLRGLSYKTLDRQVLGDVKRLARIPYTRHEKSGRLCVPVDMERRPVLLMPGALEGYRRHGLKADLVRLAAEKVNKRILEAQRPKPRPGKPRGDRGLRPCMEDFMTRSSLDHKLRVALAAELHAHGWSEPRIIEAFRGLSDFNQKVTAYQVRSVIRGGIKPFRCATIQGLGGCLGADCPIYKRRRGG